MRPAGATHNGRVRTDGSVLVNIGGGDSASGTSRQSVSQTASQACRTGARALPGVIPPRGDDGIHPQR